MDYFDKLHDKIFWYKCVKLDCDNLPFKITESELRDAEGEIWCWVCESVCKLTNSKDCGMI